MLQISQEFSILGSCIYIMINFNNPIVSLIIQTFENSQNQYPLNPNKLRYERKTGCQKMTCGLPEIEVGAKYKPYRV